MKYKKSLSSYFDGFDLEPVADSSVDNFVGNVPLSAEEDVSDSEPEPEQSEYDSDDYSDDESDNEPEWAVPQNSFDTQDDEYDEIDEYLSNETLNNFVGKSGLSEKDQFISTLLTMDDAAYEQWYSTLGNAEIEYVTKLLTPPDGKYVRGMQLSGKQTLCALLDNRVALYSGGAGSGKTHVLLYNALQYAHYSHYAGVIVMRNLENMEQLIDRSEEILHGKGCKYNSVIRRWVFAEGGTLNFSYLQHDGDQLKYKGKEYHFIGVDELTRFKTSSMPMYLVSRMRKVKGDPIPIRWRAATNPGDHGGCFKWNEDTQVWTVSRGWQPITDIQVGELVWSLDQEGVMCQKHVTAVPKFDYNGELISIRSRGLKMLNMTPNHRVPKAGGHRGISRGSNYVLTEVQKLPGQAHIYRQSKWESGVELKSFTVPKTEGGRILQNQTISGDDYFEFMGWYLSEGSVNMHNQGSIVSISQKEKANPDKVSRVRDLLTRCGFDFRYDGTNFTFSDRSWSTYLHQFGLCDEKFMPDIIKNGSVRQLEIFMKAIIDGDGTRSSDTLVAYYTTSRQLRDDMTECFTKTGWLVCENERGPRVGGVIDGRNVVGRYSELSICARKPRKPFVEILTGNHVYEVTTQMKRRSDKKSEHYSGLVGCLTVEDTETFYVRQEGSVWISGNSWVYDMFVNPETRNQNTVHVHMNYTDNPYIDAEDYEKSLEFLSPIERARLTHGDWDVLETGGLINPDWIKTITNVPQANRNNRVRIWDIASTVKSAANKDPDYTAGALCSYTDGMFTIENIIRFRGSPQEVEKRIIETYDADTERFGGSVDTFIEMGNNSGSKMAIDQLLRGPFKGMLIKPITSNVPKEERLRPFAVAAENGYVQMMTGSWNKDFQIELSTFPSEKRGFHDDMVDAVGYCYLSLVVSRRKTRATVSGLGRDKWSNSQLLTVVRAR